MPPQIADDTLDRLLGAAAPVAPPAHVAAAKELALLTRQAAHEPQPPRTTFKRRRIALGAAAAAAVLSGAGTVAAYELSIPPFQTTEPGVFRLRPPVVIDYASPSGQQRRCEAFPEFMNLSSEQEMAARDWAKTQDWTGYGEMLAASANAARADVQEEREELVMDAFAADLRGRLVEEIVPGVSQDAIGASERGEAFLAGYGSSCSAVPDDE